MAPQISNAHIEEFMSSPLVAWFRTCIVDAKHKLTYGELVDGVLIHKVFMKMNFYGHAVKNMSPPNGNQAQRLYNLRKIVGNLRLFHGGMMLEPELRLIAVAAESHVREVELLLQLVLGCAMTCPNKRFFIERIALFDHGVQEVIASHIAKTFEGPWNNDKKRQEIIERGLRKYAERLELLEEENTRLHSKAKSAEERRDLLLDVPAETLVALGYPCSRAAMSNPQ